jgi:hypothetical protein
MSCVVQFSSGTTVYGNTTDLSLDGVAVEATSMADTTQNKISMGESGLLTLKFKNGAIADAILAKCQVMHLLANGIGLSVRFSELNKKDLNLLGQMIASGKPEVDSF